MVTFDHCVAWNRKHFYCKRLVACDENWRDSLHEEIYRIQQVARNKVASCILVLRGHKSNEGNLFQFLKLQQTDVEGLQSFIDEGQYLSHKIIKDMT